MPLRTLFMGSPEMALPSLEALLASEHRVVGVVSQPDRPVGRGHKLSSPPVAEMSRKHGIPLLQPDSLKGNATFLEAIASLRPDIIVVVAYGKILPREILDLPPLKCVNVHFSLLPKYRGAAPVQWALIQDEEETGVTTFYLVPKLDAGPILLQRKVAIQEEDNTGLLGHRLSVVGADLLLETLRRIDTNDIVAHPQTESEATPAPPLKKDDGRIDWSQKPRYVVGQIRGMNPWPGAYTTLRGKRLVVHHARKLEGRRSGHGGEILMRGPEGVEVACGSGAILLTEVQLEGGRKMAITEFSRGHSLAPGERLGM